MKAFLIDPYAMTVTETTYSGNYNEIYGKIDCSIFTCVTFNDEEDTVFIDDEGLVNGKEQAFFRIIDTPRGDTYPLVGKGLVLGTDEDGESVEPKITLEKLKKQIQFIPAILVRQFI
jgi:hypothetical protein